MTASPDKMTGTERICPQCDQRMSARRCPQCSSATVSATLVTANHEDSHGLIGTCIAGRYDILGVLGKGGMGTVYRGMQLGIDRPVAIKVMSREISSDMESIKRFQREAKLTSQLNHPNTIRLYDFGLTEDESLYLVMELLEGRELADRVAGGQCVDVQAALDICIQILRALREAHELDIVHRDLKPENIFLSQVTGEGEVVKVMDFGIAKSVRGDVSRVTAAGTLVGTPVYMSPEQARGVPLDGRSDIYAVGTILFQLLAGRLPFESNPGDAPVQVLLAKLTRKAPTLASVAPNVAGLTVLEPLLASMLDQQPHRRPASAQDAIDLLEAAREKIGAPEPAARPSEGAVLDRTRAQTARTTVDPPTVVGLDGPADAAPTVMADLVVVPGQGNDTDATAQQDVVIVGPSRGLEDDETAARDVVVVGGPGSVGAGEATALQDVVAPPPKSRARAVRPSAPRAPATPAVSESSSARPSPPQAHAEIAANPASARQQTAITAAGPPLLPPAPAAPRRGRLGLGVAAAVVVVGAVAAALTLSSDRQPSTAVSAAERPTTAPTSEIPETPQRGRASSAAGGQDHGAAPPAPTAQGAPHGPAPAGSPDPAEAPDAGGSPEPPADASAGDPRDAHGAPPDAAFAADARQPPDSAAAPVAAVPPAASPAPAAAKPAARAPTPAVRAPSSSPKPTRRPRAPAKKPGFKMVD